MRILFTHQVRDREVFGPVDLHVCPTEDRGDEAVTALFKALCPDFVVLKDKAAVARLGRLVRTAALKKPCLLVLQCLGDDDRDVPGVLLVDCRAVGDPDIATLQRIEEWLHAAREIPRPRLPFGPESEVAVVGAGIVSLVSALRLSKVSARIKVYSADPKPGEVWTGTGCTQSGEDARIFSFNESRQHHFRGDPSRHIERDQYRKTVAENGWLSCSPESLSPADQRWIAEYESLPQWILQKIQKEIVGFNVESHSHWMALMAECGELFEGVGYCDRLFRVYQTPELYRKGLFAEKQIGSFLREVDEEEAARLLGFLSRARQEKEIGGVLEVMGFSVNIHKFMNKLISILEGRGVEFHWGTVVDRIEFDNGRVSGLVFKGGVVRADFYSISPGIPLGGVLAGTASAEKIGAMAGCWITLPDPEGLLRFPLKIGRSGYASTEAAAGANAIPARDRQGNRVIHISSGHGYVGADPGNFQDEYLIDLQRTVHETAKDLFPDLYAAAGLEARRGEKLRFCIRPWTPSCLGLFEAIPTAGGGLFVLTGGHNTGGFAHSPAVAEAVLAAFEGREHSMHQKYHPNRLDGLFAPQSSIVGE